MVRAEKVLSSNSTRVGGGLRMRPQNESSDPRQGHRTINHLFASLAFTAARVILCQVLGQHRASLQGDKRHQLAKRLSECG